MTRRTLLAIGVSTLVAVAATVAGGYEWAVQEPAVAATHDRAVLLFNAMETYRGSTALDQALEARRYRHVWIVVAHDTPAGREIVLTVTAFSDRRTNADIHLGPTGDPQRYRATRCYRWTQDRAWDTAEQVPCPTARIIDPARGPDRPSATAATMHPGADFVRTETASDR